MMLPQDGCLLRIFVDESDRHEGKLLYEWIVLKAREEGLAGATVLRGMPAASMAVAARMRRGRWRVAV